MHLFLIFMELRKQNLCFLYNIVSYFIFFYKKIKKYLYIFVKNLIIYVENKIKKTYKFPFRFADRNRN